MSKAILSHPLGNLIFNPETGWSGDVERLVASLNRNYPPGFKPASVYTYQPDGELIPAYAAAELLGASVFVIRDEPPEDEVVGGQLTEDGEMVERGGKGSGHHGHVGRPGKRGGSKPDPGGHVEPLPEPEKPKPPATTAAAHGEAFDYKRRLPRPKQWVWGDGWMNKVTPEGAPNYWLKMLAREGKKRMRREFGALALGYYKHPEDAPWKDGDWFRFFREDLDAGSQSSYMHWSAKDLLRAGHEFNDAWTTEDEVKDAVADMYAAEFASYYKKFAKDRSQKTEVGNKQKEWAQSTAFLSPQDGFFSIPDTERWDGAREAVQAIADSGLRLPERFKARFDKPKPDGSLPFVETKGRDKWGHYMSSSIMASSIALNLIDTRPSEQVAATAVHEIGHMIEHLGFHWGDLPEMEPGPRYDAMEAYHQAVRDSGYLERVKNWHPREGRRISKPIEVFARGFMQYTASRLKKASPTAQKRNAGFIRTMDEYVEQAQRGGLEPPLYYSWEEFEGVERAFDKLFEVGTWRKK